MNDDEDDLQNLREYVHQLRPVQGIQSQDNKSPLYRKRRQIEESEIARDLLEAAGLRVEGLTSSQCEPPDLEGTIGGRRVGIEVTELIAEETINSYKQSNGTRVVRKEWTKDEFIAAASARISRKDRARPITRFDQYILLIYTHEMYLSPENVLNWLSGTTSCTRLIASAFFGFPDHSPPRVISVGLDH